MSSASRPWYRLRIRTLLLLLVITVVLWSLYSYWNDYSERQARVSRELMTPTAGTSCRVLFRSDAVGVEKSGVRWGEVNGVANSIGGEFVKMNEQWLVITSEQGEKTVERWIPREQVLFIEIEK